MWRVDATTGETLWVYNPKSYEEGSPSMSNPWTQRGVAYWTDGEGDERIFWGTGSGHLVCVQAKTGRPCPDFGPDGNGMVDAMVGVPRADREARDYLNAMVYSIFSPPIIVRDRVIHGSQVADVRITKEAVPGWVRAWNVRTGAHEWDFHTVPNSPDEFGSDTWQNESWRYSGNANVWGMLAGDSELGHVYLPTGTSTSDYYGGHRPGDNLFAESIIAVDVETGQRVWHFQAVHHGLWDYDFPTHPNLVDITVDGREIKALAQVSKQGFTYVFDRVTGDPVWPIEERPVPQETNLPGEVLSPTQPFPDQAAAIRVSGRLDRRPGRLHAGDPGDGGKGPQRFSHRTALHPAAPRRRHRLWLHHPAVDRRRGQLDGGRRRPSNGDALRPVEQRPLGDVVLHARPGRRRQLAIHAERLRERQTTDDAPGAAIVQATLLANDGDRSEHRRDRLDETERGRRPHS